MTINRNRIKHYQIIPIENETQHSSAHNIHTDRWTNIINRINADKCSTGFKTYQLERIQLHSYQIGNNTNRNQLTSQISNGKDKHTNDDDINDDDADDDEDYNNDGGDDRKKYVPQKWE